MVWRCVITCNGKFLFFNDLPCQQLKYCTVKCVCKAQVFSWKEFNVCTCVYMRWTCVYMRWNDTTWNCTLYSKNVFLWLWFVVVQSDRCRLSFLRPRELVQAHEEAEVCIAGVSRHTYVHSYKSILQCTYNIVGDNDDTLPNLTFQIKAIEVLNYICCCCYVVSFRSLEVILLLMEMNDS